ncbi:MAG: hypothetical protein LUQ50_09125 [Methanospirillum sp.]|uniref:hypothetical protein n=1 Tax=Methanospirillum sp. TaxID=45200 RepID=UPI00237506FD|nr:hypothetical protein [Methanospirillum sp.]MDD1729220.1 hypothetical protein [Methanospirillum sp.]
MYLGDYIVIESQEGTYRFSCSCVSTGTDFVAEVDPDKRKFFDDHSFPQQNPSACRFLRPLGEGRIGCTIHADSPAQCKYYRCRVMDIFSEEGEFKGYITGTLALHSEDTALQMIYERVMHEITGSEPQQEEQIQSQLVQAGYLVRYQ